MTMRQVKFGWVGAAFALAVAAMPVSAQQTTPPPAAANKEESHEGYYYPPVTSRESYAPRSKLQPEANRTTRIAFATEISNKMLSASYPPMYAIFAKGDAGEKLIIVAITDNYFGNLYRGRALLAMLTAQARTTPIFTKFGVEDFFTFFDLAHMLGYKQITISDGKSYTHQITLK